MSAELALRLVGMIVCLIIGGRFGVEIAVTPPGPEVYGPAFGLVGALIGLILTPYFTTRPARAAQRAIRIMPAEVLVTSIFGLVVGLLIAALLAVPLSFLPQPWSAWMPALAAIVSAYLSITIFALRAEDIFLLLNRFFGRAGSRGTGRLSPASLAGADGALTVRAAPTILLDSSAIIDGRILDISKTGFLNGDLVVPGFILRELQHIADENNPQRRSRGRRGLEILEEMKRESKAPLQVLEIDADGVREVDHKLVALCKQMDAQLLTTDHVLNRTARLQGVRVLNINELANAVKTALLPNEVITIQIIAEGREAGQGVGYLEDGTMVVVEEGRRYLDRMLDVVITRMIQTTAGKMYFARPEENPRK